MYLNFCKLFLKKKLINSLHEVININYIFNPFLIQGLTVKEKDFAGFVPLDKAALKGHHEAVRTLLRFGADPSSGIKGTKAIHDGKFIFAQGRYFKLIFIVS